MSTPQTDGTHATQAAGPNACGQVCAADANGGLDPAWCQAAARARLLSWLLLAYMNAEGVIAIVAAVLAGSVALLGFGRDSAIEGLASGIIIWRFTGARTRSHTAEARAVWAPSSLRRPPPVRAARTCCAPIWPRRC